MQFRSCDSGIPVCTPSSTSTERSKQRIQGTNIHPQEYSSRKLRNFLLNSFDDVRDGKLTTLVKISEGF